MPKIVVTHPMGLAPEQKSRLQKLGEVTFYDVPPTSPDDWLKRCEGFSIILSWMAGLREGYDKLKNVFVSVPFVGVGTFANPTVLKKNKITISNSPGCNRHPVSEWIIYMMLLTMRGFNELVKTTTPVKIVPPPHGLAGKNITILGNGNIGKRVGKICQALEMNVTFFNRGGNLLASIKNADIIVDVLSTNPTSVGLLNKKFFNSVKKGAIFISVTTKAIEDFEAMIAALDKGTLSFVAHDVADAKPGDSTNPIYLEFCRHPKVFATPHIAGFSDMATKIGNDMMIDNVEAWVKGHPLHVFNG